MKRLKICVYAICKNEAKFVDHWMDSMQEADLVVVTDTGSQDDTVTKLRARGAEVYVDIVRPWRFDVARNISLNHVPTDVDICVCTDLDERFEPGWRERLEQAWQSHTSEHSGPTAKTGRYLFNWSLKPDGTPDVQFYYFKIHDRQGFQWRCPVHEYISYEGALPLDTIYIDGVVLNHYPDATKSRGSYLKLLELAVEEDPTDERMCYYLSREYRYQGQWQKCIDAAIHYLNMPQAKWSEERCAAMRGAAKACEELGRTQEAYQWYWRAIAEAPHRREAYVDFERLCYTQKDWLLVLYLGEQALKIVQKSRTYINMGYAWDHTADDLCAIAAYNLQLIERSLEHAKKALQLAPEDARLRRNLELIQQAIKTAEDKKQRKIK